MVYRVAQQVDDGVHQLLQHASIQLDAFAVQLQPHRLPQLLAQIAHHPGETVEQLGQRSQPGPQDAVVHGPHQGGDTPAHRLELGPDLGPHQSLESVAGDHQLPHLIHQLVQPRRINPHRAWGLPPGQSGSGEPGRRRCG